MKKKITEIRWHGRGGQGIQTASFLLAEAMINCGMEAQGFPEYGPEKSGAPVAAYNRLSKTKILTHENVKNPDVVVIMDQSMISNDGDFTNPLNAIWNIGVTQKTVIIANLPREFPKANCCTENIHTIDATSIARKFIGKPIPNTTLMGMLIRQLSLDYHGLIQSFEDRLAKKLPQKIVEGNMKCIDEGYNYEKK
jgi:pyruvate ferredoxin oxidoreductase gamma subunit